MSRKVVIGLCAAFAVFAFGVMTVGQASGATMKTKEVAPAFLAIYGNPGVNGTTAPVGGGLGLNFGFGQNMLFQAETGVLNGNQAEKNLSFTLASGATSEACDSYIGGTLMSNKTGKETPLSFGIEFADFQCNRLNGVNAGLSSAAYADTQDQKWIAEICPMNVAACRVEPLNTVGTLGGEENVKIEHVAILITTGAGALVVQGAVWGKWKDGKPPCIELQAKPPLAPSDQNLMVTQAIPGTKVGEVAVDVKGKACLISANNDWYSQSEKTEPEIVIANE